MPILLSTLRNAAKKTLKGIPATAYKHPVITAVGVGGGLGAANMQEKANDVERSIMREYAGTSASKYAGESFTKFAEHKDACVIKTCSLTKTGAEGYPSAFLSGDPTTFGVNAEQAASRGIVSEAVGAVRRLLGFGAQKAVDKIRNEPKRRQIVDTIIETDPHVSEFERQNPGQAVQAFQTMRRVAPTLSTDPNIVLAYLRNTAMTGGALDFPTVKSLAEAETAVHKAKNEGAWLRGGF